MPENKKNIVKIVVPQRQSAQQGTGSLRISQDKLAAHFGTTHEVIAKLLRKLVADKIVETTSGKIIVEQPDALASIFESVITDKIQVNLTINIRYDAASQ